MQILNENNNGVINKNGKEFKGKVNAIWGNNVNLDAAVFNGLTKEIKVSCVHGMTFSILANKLLKGETKCEKCRSMDIVIPKVKSIKELIIDSDYYMGVVTTIGDYLKITEELSLEILRRTILSDGDALDILAGRISKIFENPNNSQDEKEAIYIASCKLILKLKEIEIVEIERREHHSMNPLDFNETSVTYKVTSLIEPMAEMKLEKYPAPLLKPAEDYDVDNNESNGSHVIMGDKQNKHTEKQRLDVLNKLQKIPFTLHQISENFIPECPTDKDIIKANKKLKNWEVFNETIGITKLIVKNKSFYYNFKVDKRGRNYCAAYALNLQGSEFQKAQVEFADKEIVNVDDDTISDTSKTIRFEDMSPFDILLVVFANHFGLDKENWNKRLEWSINNLDTFKECKYNKEPLKSIIKNAEEPILLKKAIMSYRIAMKGDAIGLQVYFDATASFSQIASVLLGNEKEMQISNVISNLANKRIDPYMVVAEEFSPEWFQEEPKPHEIRKAVKKPIMTSSYNSTLIPKTTFKEEYLDKFYDIMEKKLPASTKMKKLINKCYGKGRKFHELVMPDGAICYMPSIKKINKKVKIDGLDEAIMFTTNVNMSDIGNSRSLSPNTTAAYDAYIMAEMIRMADFQLYGIHDSFSCGLNHAVQMLKNYRIVMANLYMSNPLKDSVRQLSNGKVRYVSRFRSERVVKKILESQYCLC